MGNLNIKAGEGKIFDVHRAYDKLLRSDADTKSWLGNSSPRTRDGNFRRLGRVCTQYGKTPQALKKLSPKQAFNFICQVRDDMAAKGLSSRYISTVVVVLKSFFAFNEIDVAKRVNINRTPAVFDKVPPSTEELHEILREADRRARAAISFIAFSGVRPEVLGDYLGTDGLKIRDVEGLNIKDGRVDFAKIPAKVMVRSELSKNKKAYFTFLSDEGCQHVKGYLEWRLSKEEKLAPDSPVITSDQHQGRFGRHIRVKDVSCCIRNPIRAAFGKKYRPYSLKHWFAHKMVESEGDGLMPHEWKVFLIGHSGTVEGVYTTEGLSNKEIERMREAYAKCSQKHLSTTPQSITDEVTKQFESRLQEQSVKLAKMMARVLGSENLEINGIKVGDVIDDKWIEKHGEHVSVGEEITEERFVEMMKRKMEERVEKKIVTSEEAEKLLLEDGWTIQGSLPNGKVFLTRPKKTS